MLVQAMAKDLGRHRIRVNAICRAGSGPRRTPAPRSRWRSTRGCGRGSAGQAGDLDVAKVALFLLSDAWSTYVTGQNIAVDGGLCLHNWLDGSGPRSVSATRARPAYTSSHRLTGTAAARTATEARASRAPPHGAGASAPPGCGRGFTGLPAEHAHSRRREPSPSRPAKCQVPDTLESGGPAGVGLEAAASTGDYLPEVVHRGRAGRSARRPIVPGGR